jgi:periplasmic protein TonB
MFVWAEEGLNHYEILGLTPAATKADIEEAFATRTRMQITDDYRLKLREAYKVLRDPFWRRLYDTELGFGSDSRSGPALTPARHSVVEDRVAPFIAAALRQSAGQTEHPSSPDPETSPDLEEPESIVEESSQPFIADIDHSAAAEDPVSDPRGGWREWNRAAAVTGGAVLGVGLVALLIGQWGSFDSSPNTARAPASARLEQPVARSSIVAQTAPQQAAPIKEGSASPPVETTTPVQANGVDSAPLDSSASNPAQAPADNGSADTNVASQPESSTVASSAIPQAPPSAAASTSVADPLAASPVTVAQSAPAAVAQPASPAPAVRPAPVVNRAAAPKWISGGLVKSDNPRGRYRGTVTVRFTVRPDGRVSGCRPAVSSGSAALDAHTCQLVEERLRFRPALDWEGRAIPYETGAIYTWGVRHRSLLDQLLHPGSR